MPKIALLLLSLVLVGCAELLGRGPPGAPDGGAYCWRIQNTGRMACYPSQEERDAAYHVSEETERKARAAFQAAVEAQEAARKATVQAAAVQKAAQEDAARESQRRQSADFVAERDRKDAVRAAAAAVVHARALEKQYAGPAISAIMCSIDETIRGLRADLAHEKRVTAVSGVVNLKARNDIARDLVDESDELAGWAKALARYSAPRAACKDVAGIEECRQNLDKCEGETRDIAQVWANELETLWGSKQEHPSR